LKRLRLSVSHKSPQKRLAGAWTLHYDNAPAHTAHSIQVFLASHGVPVVQQIPYSHHMALCDFWLFPQLKTVLKGKRFEDIDAMNVFSSGRTAGRIVSAHKQGILKIINYF
jgi:hypothetical protein